MRAIPFFLILLFIGCGLEMVPEAVHQSFSQKYPGVGSVQWGIDKNGYYEAHFKWEGVKLRADFTVDGNWVETESSILFNDLPEAVKAAIEKAYSKKDIEEIERTDHHQKGVFYDVEFKSKGVEKFDVEFAEDGSVLAKKRR